MISGLCTNETALFLGCMSNVNDHDEAVEKRAQEWSNEHDVKYVIVVLWSPPIESGQIRVLRFRK